MMVIAIAAAAGAAFTVFYFWPPRITPVSRRALAKFDEQPLDLE